MPPAASTPLSVLEVVRKTSEFLASKGVESARLNSELIVGHALGLPRMRLYLEFERAVSEAELGSIREMVRRRGRREPLQYVIGHCEFHGLRLKADRRALIPRPETEFLVETLLGRLPSPPARILDLGTGGGAIALALAKAYPEARVTAADSSADALALAAENAEAAGLSARVAFVASDWFGSLLAGEKFGLIVSNPPYLSGDEAASAPPEVRNFEPARALASGAGGFADIAAIIAGAPGFLLDGALLAIETGPGHHALAGEAAAAAGLGRSESLKDLAGRDRYFLAWR
ncbi:MAG TPA: peptide chain release factor N(5)-glutamine methyltransferase [Opitutaceae bacterium]|jgi:release factor glutamine methyltransferase